MTTLRVEINGVVRTVQAKEDGDHVVVELDGRTYCVDAAEGEPGRWSLLLGDRCDSPDVRVRAGREGVWVVLVDGTPVAVRAAGRRQDAIDGVRRTDGPVRITAPMPGKVVRVLVAPGAPLEARQGVVVVEAMKMENELRAPRAGTVRDVLAREGALVEAGALLVTIE
jgi:biotin carboxyl carrier protein